MGRRFWIVTAVLAALVLAGSSIYIYLQIYPPLAVASTYSSGDRDDVVMEIGNSGIRTIELETVEVNGTAPEEAHLQRIDPAEEQLALIGSATDADGEFLSLQGAVLETDTSPRSVRRRVENGSSSGAESLYGLGLAMDEAIETVWIRYRYFGIPLEQTIEVQR
ncbi:hypothetical protein [Alkalicoccus urumqiensis]|uniref:Uncharacterized protein n=1 Tax=Alkalicoccus urumqiensis TaxID=1548213 RepID=A0A2P6ME17_ALKUR|nr:hypothetical protein [Alkalicoccus urumqiensis]PRO64528.1 hypothetical protein C6I21_14495 [Alkalicoccus urumqiensis]